MINELSNIEDYKEEIKKNIDLKKLTKPELCKIMHIKGEIMRASFINALNELEIEGKIYLDEEGYYKRFDAKQLGKIQGEIHINNLGKGFVNIEKDGHKIKYLINEENLNGALEGDTVILKDIHHGKTNYADAKVEKIIKRAKGKTVFEYKGEGEFIPYTIYGNVTVICPKEELKQIVTGHRVLVDIGKEKIATIENKAIFEGHIEKIIGHKDDPDIEISTIAANHGFFKEFPEEVIKQLKEIPNEVTKEDIQGRKDLRGKKIFTIDGKDTKDMDDAISIVKFINGYYLLSVHIADVTYYIKENSPLDLEAKKRATSAYLADTVIPMFPHQISNGICSLNEKVDRLTKTVDMFISPEGRIISYEIYNSVINSKKKMNYDDVNKILDKKEIPKGYENFVYDLLVMEELSEKFNKTNKKEGKVDFASDEIKIITSPTGEALEFLEHVQRKGERLIENFMVAANSCVAEYYKWLETPQVYRVHGNPNDDSLINSLKTLKKEKLCSKEMVDSLINKIKNGRYNSNDLNLFLEYYRKSENYGVISHLILTSMSRAKYSSSCDGHYGLGLSYYTHFTSPIRRHPDLMVHRLLDPYHINDNKEYSEQELKEYTHILPEICEYDSKMEREADQAEKETLDLKMAEYMQKEEKINPGKVYQGRIIDMTPYDTKIKLDNNVIGHVTPQDLAHAKAIGHNKKLKLGERVYVLIKEVSIPNRIIYFNLNYKELSKPRQKVLK